MQQTLTHFHEDSLGSLAQYLRHRSALPLYQSSPRIGIGSSRRLGSFDLSRSSSLHVKALSANLQLLENHSLESINFGRLPPLH
jgi:mRNA degradation ribonuclease J1/J2